ncbi:MAG: uncharacterized membrane protein HdeD (DUF308 family) [Alphaproteobacteria bacterium]
MDTLLLIVGFSGFYIFIMGMFDLHQAQNNRSKKWWRIFYGYEILFSNNYNAEGQKFVASGLLKIASGFVICLFCFLSDMFFY